MAGVSGGQLLHALGQVLGLDLSLSTNEALQNCIVDETILVLQEHTQRYTYVTKNTSLKLLWQTQHKLHCLNTDCTLGRVYTDHTKCTHKHKHKHKHKHTHTHTHTCVWTIFILCCLSLVTMCGMSTTFSLTACSRAMSTDSRVPVRPTPALYREHTQWLILYQKS